MSWIDKNGQVRVELAHIGLCTIIYKGNMYVYSAEFFETLERTQTNLVFTIVRLNYVCFSGVVVAFAIVEH